MSIVWTNFNKLPYVIIKMKKILFILVNFMLSTYVTVSAQRAVKVDGVIYTVEDASGDNSGHATAVRTTDEIINLIIPDEVDYEGEKYKVTAIEKDVFKGKNTIKTVELNDGLVRIGGHAFDGCSGIQSLTIPATVTYIGPEAFANCSGLKEMVIENKTNNEAVESGNNFLSIGEQAFDGCSGIQSLIIPASVTYIGPEAFANCSGLTEVIIKDGVEILETNLVNQSYPFYQFDPTEIFTNCNIKELYLNRPTEEISFRQSGVQNVIIGSNVTSITEKMFKNLETLKSVTIEGESLVKVGKDAFSGCSNLSQMNLPESLTRVDECAFTDCRSLKLRVPKSLKYIGYLSFGGCGLDNLRLNLDNYTYIGNYAFKSCMVDTITLSGDLQSWKDYIFSGSMVSTLIVEGSCKTIGYYAFHDCGNLKNVILNDGLEIIGYGAFNSCPSIEKLSIPGSVRKIYTINWNYYKEIVFEDSDTPVEIDLDEMSNGYRIHSSSKSVRKAYIGRTLEKSNCSYNCMGGTTTPFHGSPLKEVELGPKAEIINKLLCNCDSLEKVVIAPDRGSYGVGAQAFFGCKRLTTIDFPEGLTYVGSRVFDKSGLKQMAIHDIVPPKGENDSFDDEIYSKVTLYVPAESVELYQTSMPWIMFNKIVGVDFAEIDEIGTDATDEEAAVEYFNLSGVKVNGDNLSKGIYLRRQGSTVTKIAVK